ncbi:hypothetical protein LPTSP4_06190 [Leptospira ryugenii]|uniref:Tetratricopeptide repeat protein n=1 Tax=Leptospira ryugenii TaxID=1917863 RepID=A0A2P2DWU8_9LEPT|nr:hypothetical protein [Leptospira ryugenii]GBF49109.1 hypothetical protein LPTSP4_06190 [Leptospira ryugenii]
MANQAMKEISTSVENEAWELFEVGSWDEVIELAKTHPNHFFLQHLSYLAEYELQSKAMGIPPKGISSLSPLVESLSNFLLGNYKEAGNQLNLYFQSSQAMICYSIIQLAIKIYFRAEMYAECRALISSYKKLNLGASFVKEEITVLYHLRRYEELLKLFRENIKLLNDVEVHKIVGMSLLFLDRHKEANLIFDNIPGKLTLPSFEEKRKAYTEVYGKIKQLEKDSKDLSLRELEDMGFAYLFHGDYEKAEKTFLSITSKLKSKLCIA